MLLELSDALSEARLLHGREGSGAFDLHEDGFFSIFRKPVGAGRPTQRSYSLSMLDEVVRATRGSPDVYLSQSSFLTANRKSVNVRQVRAAWVDLDLYNKGMQADAATVDKILRHGERLGLPMPSSVIYSGRGVYLKWYFERPVPAVHLPTWIALQAALTAAYKSLAADAKSRDVSRVFRLLQSINTKSGEEVRRIEGSGVLHDFAALCAVVEAFRADELPGAQETAADAEQGPIEPRAGAARSLFRQVIEGAERGDPEALTLYSELRRPILLEKRSARSLNWARFLDLRDLAVSRGGIAVGERDLHMLWMLNSLAHSGVVTTANWANEVRALQKAFPTSDGFDALTDGSMDSLKKRLELSAKGVMLDWKGTKVTPLYRPGNALLIQTFGISAQEQQGMRTIICTEEKQSRRRERLDEIHEGRAQRRADRQGLEQAVAQAFERARQACEHDMQGLTRINISALAKVLEADRSAVSRLWKRCLQQAGLLDLLDQRRKSEIPARRAKPRVCDASGQQAETSATAASPEKIEQAKEVEPPASALSADEIRQRLQDQQAQRMARTQAIEAQQRLALSRKLQSMSDAWAKRQVQQITHAASVSQPGDPMSTMPSTGTEMTVLERRMAMLRAAQGLEAMPASQQRTPPQARTAPAQAGAPLSAAERLRAMQKKPALAASGPAPASPPVAAFAVAAPAAATRPAATFVPATVQAPAKSATGQTAQERLRALASTRDRIAPYQLEKVQQTPNKPLIEGGPAAPEGYPDAQQWPQDDVPPGSRYSSQEWQAARVGQGGARFAVLEVQTKNESMLIQIPMTGADAPSGKRVVYKDGKTRVEEGQQRPTFSGDALSGMLGMFFSDCLIVTENSWPQFKDAAEAKFNHNGIDMRVIRPRVDYIEPERAWRVGAQWSSLVQSDTPSLPGQEPSLISALIQQESDEQAEEESEEQPAAPRLGS